MENGIVSLLNPLTQICLGIISGGVLSFTYQLGYKNIECFHLKIQTQLKQLEGIVYWENIILKYFGPSLYL